MAGLRSKTVLVYDYGQFVELAITLSKDFGRVLYFAPWVIGGSPTSPMRAIGDGIDGVERVDEIWSHIDDVDLVVFPDVHEPELQEDMVKRGKRVWGCRGGAELEVDRVASKEIARRLGIKVPPYVVVTGVDALTKHLQANNDQWVKIDGTRGDMETFHSPTFEDVEQQVDKLASDLGPKKNIMRFICEQSIDPAVEAGYDGYTVDGKFPNESLIGIETKCQAYIGKTMRYAQLPAQVREVNDKLSPALKRYGYRGFISTEIRCTKDLAYLIDPCCRCGSPPSELYQVMIDNLGEIIWEGAGGLVIEPEYRAKFGAMVLLQSEWASDEWQHVSFPEKYRENVKLHNLTVIDGEHYVIPFVDRRTQIGAVVAMGNTADEAINECKKICDEVKGHMIEKPVAALDKAREQLEKLIGSEKKQSPAERKAEAMLRSGRISDRQYDKMMARG